MNLTSIFNFSTTSWLCCSQLIQCCNSIPNKFRASPIRWNHQLIITHIHWMDVPRLDSLGQASIVIIAVFSVISQYIHMCHNMTLESSRNSVTYYTYVKWLSLGHNDSANSSCTVVGVAMRTRSVSMAVSSKTWMLKRIFT